MTEHESNSIVKVLCPSDSGSGKTGALASLVDAGLKVRTLRLPDIFQDQGKPEAMYAEAGLDAEGIVAGALSALGVDNAAAAGPAGV